MTAAVVITHRHGSVVPQCYKDNADSQWKSLKFDPIIRKRLNLWSPKRVCVIASRKFISVQNDTTIWLGDLAFHICEVAYKNHSVSFFGVRKTRYPKAAESILTLSTSKDTISRENVPFGIKKNEILHFDPSPKNEIFG